MYVPFWYVGNVLTAADPMGNVTTTSYDAFGKPLSVTYADGSAVSTTTYNMLGLATEVTDARGNTTHYYYDDKRGRTLFVNFWLKNKETSDTIQVRGDKSGKKSTRNQRNRIVSHSFPWNK